jgi:hypothetical protein
MDNPRPDAVFISQLIAGFSLPVEHKLQLGPPGLEFGLPHDVFVLHLDAHDHSVGLFGGAPGGPLEPRIGPKKNP